MHTIRNMSDQELLNYAEGYYVMTKQFNDALVLELIRRLQHHVYSADEVQETLTDLKTQIRALAITTKDNLLSATLRVNAILEDVG